MSLMWQRILAHDGSSAVKTSVLRYGGALLEDPDHLRSVAFLSRREIVFSVQLLLSENLSSHHQSLTLEMDCSLMLCLKRAPEPTKWLNARGKQRLENVETCAIDLSGPYRKVIKTTVPRATVAADPFNLFKDAN